MQIRPASAGEANLLSELAYASEAFWGYDTDFMSAFRAKYRVTEEQILSELVQVLEDEGAIVGFFYVMPNIEITELEFFYIAPQFIGKGYGEVLWQALMGFCRDREIAEIELVTSPQAVGFYERMGAQVVGEVVSMLREGRLIPKLRAVVKK